MPKRLLAVLDEGLVEKFCNGTASEHHDAEQELQHRLRTMLEKQSGDVTFSLEGAPVVNGGVTDLKLSALAVLQIQQLQKHCPVGKEARIVQVEFGPGRFHTLVEVGTAVHHISMQNGEATKELRP